MSKTTEFINEITSEMKIIRNLSEDLQEHYRNLGALLVGAKTLVKEETWGAWLTVNCNVNPVMADVIINREYINHPMVAIGFQGDSMGLLEDKIEPISKNKLIQNSNRKRLISKRRK